MIVKIIYPEGDFEEIEVEEQEVTLGRGATNDIVVSDDQISRVHISIKIVDDIFYIKDMTLSNWVSYNEEKLSKIDYVQYFDFAKLVLPGGISLQIRSLSSDDKDGESTLEKSIAGLNTKTGTQNVDQDIFQTTIKKKARERAREKKPRTKGKNKNSKKDKGMTEFFIMAIVLVVVAVFFTLKIYNEKIEIVTPIIPQAKKSPEKPAVKPEVEVSTKKIKKDASKSVTNDEFLTYSSFGSKDKKCSTEPEKILCFKVFKSRIDGEGVIIRGNVLYVFKDFNKGGIEFYQSTKRFSKSNLVRNVLAKVIAAQGVTNPTNILAYKEIGITRINIFLFQKEKNNEMLNHFSFSRSNLDGMHTSIYRSAIKRMKQNQGQLTFNEFIGSHMMQLK